MLNGAKEVRLVSQALLRRERNGGLLYEASANRLFRLDAEAFAIAEACTSGIDYDQLCQLVHGCAGSLPGVNDFLRQLCDLGLLISTSTRGPRQISHDRERFQRNWSGVEAECLSPVSGPLLVYLELTHKCNLVCAYCYNNSGPSRTDQIDGTRIKALLDDFRKLGVFYVSFTGGEPLLRKDIFEHLQLAHEYGIRTIVATNGTLATERVSQELARVGIDQVQVSLDAPEPEVHDRLRGRPGAFVRAVTGIRNLVKAGIPVTVCCVATEDTRPRLDPLIELARELGVKNFRILGMMSVGRGLSLPKVHGNVRSSLNSDVRALQAKYAGHINVLTNEAPSDSGCGSGTTFCAISATGDVTPCSFGSSVVVGNVNERDFLEIWESSSILNDFRVAKRNWCERYGSNSCAQAGCQADTFALRSSSDCEQVGTL